MSLQRFRLVHGEMPLSLNAGGAGSRRHWSAAHAEKKKWEAIWHALLLEQRVPKGMGQCTVEATMRWLRFPSRRPDEENYRPAITKPFADVLVQGGWLRDDTGEFYTFRGPVFTDDWTDVDQPKIVGARGRVELDILAVY